MFQKKKNERGKETNCNNKLIDILYYIKFVVNVEMYLVA